MITKKQLNELGWFIADNNEPHLFFNRNYLFDYQFNQHTNELIDYNDGFPDETPFVIIENVEHLKQVMELLDNLYDE